MHLCLFSPTGLGDQDGYIRGRRGEVQEPGLWGAEERRPVEGQPVC